jgi:hypothetical protein
MVTTQFAHAWDMAFAQQDETNVLESIQPLTPAGEVKQLVS